MSVANRYYCTACHQGQPEPGDCPSCEDEPLMDLADPDIRDGLQEMDLRVRQRHYAFVFLASMLAGAVVYFGVLTVLPDKLAEAALNTFGLFGVAGVGVVIALLSLRIWPAKRQMPPLSPRALQSIERLAARRDAKKDSDVAMSP